MTRVAIITEIIAPYRIPVFNALARRAQLELHVIFLAETDTHLRQWRVYKDEIGFSYDVLPSWRFRAGKNNLLLNSGLRSLLNDLAPDIIICGGYNYAASWQAMFWAQRHECEFVLWSESNAQDARAGRRWTESLKRYFLRHCDRFVVPGKASFNYLSSLGCPEKSIVTAPNAVNNTFFAIHADTTRKHADEVRKKLKLPARFILFVGRLVPEKGVFDLLESYAKLECQLRSEVGLVFAGDGVARPELERCANRITPGTVLFPGFAQREELASLYALAECLVLPTHSDPWGLVVNEAMASGLPVIVTSVAGCAGDLVEDGWNGFVVARADPAGLSNAIASVVRQPALRQKMSACSLERIRNFSPEVCAAGLTQVAIASGSRED